MKRAIFVLVLLTIGVTLPPFYSQWAESQRLNQIQTVKQQARPIFGEQLETVLSKLKNSNPPSVVILYTGGTKAIWNLWLLPRTIGGTPKTRLHRGADSAARVSNIFG